MVRIAGLDLHFCLWRKLWCRRDGTRRATVRRTVAFISVRVPFHKDKTGYPIGITRFMVRIVGLEPTRRRHRNLNPTRLPIPSYPHVCELKIESGKWKIIVLLKI